MDGRDDALPSAGDVARFLRRQWTTIAVVIVLAFVLALVVTAIQPRAYASYARIAIEVSAEASDVQRQLFGESDIGTQQQILTSLPLARRVLAAAGRPSSDTDAQTFLSEHVDVELETGTSILRVNVTMGQPELAARLAQGLAVEYLAYVKDDAEERLERVLGELAGEEEAIRQSLASVEQELAGEPPPEIAQSLERDRDQLYSQLRFLSSRATDFRTTNAFARPATIVEPAVPSAAPTSPRPIFNLLLALLLGVLVAVSAAILRDVVRDRITDEDSLHDLGAGPLLGCVAVASPSQPAGDHEGYKRLTARYLSLTPAHPRVTSLIPVSRGADAASVAVGLATGLDRGGRRVIAIDADLEAAPLTGLLGLRGPGLSEALTAGPADARLTGLQSTQGGRVLPVGAAVADDHLLSTRHLPELLTNLRRDCDDLLVVCSSVAAADGVAVAMHANAVVLVARVGVDRRRDVRRAVREVEAVGAVVVGVVFTHTQTPGRRLARQSPERTQEQFLRESESQLR